MKNKKYIESKRYSHVGIHSDSNKAYAMQFKQAFNILYNSQNAVDTIALPMLFTVRHYLELTLKYHIEYFGKYSDTNYMISSAKSEHNLIKLAEGFRQHWISIVKKYDIQFDDAQYTDNFENFITLIELIDTMDIKSMSFRYSHDKNHKKHFKFNDTLNIYDIHILVDKCASFFDYISYVFYMQAGHYLEIQESEITLQKIT